jgi:hypothetical protein
MDEVLGDLELGLVHHFTKTGVSFSLRYIGMMGTDTELHTGLFTASIPF